MPLLFVTSNKHKFVEVSKILGEEYSIKVKQENFLFRELESISLSEIAIDKARQAFREFSQPLIVEDTGVYFKAYKSFPGTQPKRVFEGIGYGGIFMLLSGKNRKAFFHTCMCYIDQKTIRTFEGKLHGAITKRVVPPKKLEMPYDMIFVPKGERRAIVKMAAEEKNVLSHRGKVTRMLGAWLEEKEKQDFLENL